MGTHPSPPKAGGDWWNASTKVDRSPMSQQKLVSAGNDSESGTGAGDSSVKPVCSTGRPRRSRRPTSWPSTSAIRSRSCAGAPSRYFSSSQAIPTSSNPSVRAITSHPSKTSGPHEPSRPASPQESTEQPGTSSEQTPQDDPTAQTDAQNEPHQTPPHSPNDEQPTTQKSPTAKPQPPTTPSEKASH